MSKEINHSQLLRVMAGEAGDFNLGIAAYADKKFSMIRVGPNGATFTVCTIRGVDVMTPRNYGVMPAGYLMVAGGDDYFDSVTITAGDAEGVNYWEETTQGTFALAVAPGQQGAAMIPTITFTNAGSAGSKLVHWRTKNAAGAVVQSGEAKLYFLKGAGLLVSIYGILYFATPALDYTVEVRLEGSEVWTACAPFEITA